MAEEKTLLEQVREKEVELAAEYGRACAAAEAEREAAGIEARETVERAEREGREAAEALYEQEMTALECEIGRLRSDAEACEAALGSAGEGRIDRVADDLVSFVAPVPE